MRSPQLRLQVSDLALEGLSPLLVSLQGSVGLGTEVRATRLEVIGTPLLELLLQLDPLLIQNAVHPLLEGRLALLQRLLASGQVGSGLVDHSLPALDGLPLPVEPVLECEKLLLLEAQLLFAAANHFLPCGNPSLL
jgi:hypothetical protein